MVNFCPQCGSKLQPDFKFCPSCGGRLPEDSTEPLQAIYSELHLNSVHQSVSCREDKKSLRKSNQVNEQEETTQTSSVTLQTPDASLNLSLKRKASHEVNPSPSKCKLKKRVSNVKPVQVGTEVCDQSSEKWKLVQLLWQTELDLTYAVCKANQYLNECNYIMKLGAKEGQLFNEQNFHQRAAKTDAVEKWVRLHKMDFLGIPPCVGFGLLDTYRFLVFPSMGQTLQSILDERSGSLSEKAVLQVALQLLDSIEFIHEKEYTHADIHAGNIYIKTNGHTEVFLSGFGYAFRYCPGGNHVEYRPGSRPAHQGNIHFISRDSHKGAGPSRRSDLQSLGYCMLSWMTGTLPWSHMTNTNSAIAAEKQRFISDISGLLSCCYKKRETSSALMAYLSNVMNLQYPEKPDYSHLKAGLHESLQKMGGTLKEPLDLQVKR